MSEAVARHAAPKTVIRIITRLNIGGPARQAVALSAALHAHGFRTVLVTGCPELAEGELGVPAGAGLRHVRMPQLRRPLRPWQDLVVLGRLCRLLWRERPSIVHTHMAKAGALGRLAGLLYNRLGPGRRAGARAAIVHTFHGHVLDGYFPSGITQIFAIIERWLAVKTDCLIAVSPAIRDQLLEKGIGRAAQWRVIPLGLDLSALVDLPAPRQRETLTIGMVGRLVPIKNPELFINALERSRRGVSGRPLSGVVVGDGPLRQALEARVARLDLARAIRFTGWREDLRSVHEELDVACLTSWNEGTPVALIEAMAAGRPVVATDVGGVRDLLDDDGRGTAPVALGTFRVARRGILINAGDIEGLVQALRVLADDAGLRQRLGAAGRTHVTQRYTQERLVRDIAVLYKEKLHRIDDHR